MMIFDYIKEISGKNNLVEMQIRQFIISSIQWPFFLNIRILLCDWYITLVESEKILSCYDLKLYYTLFLKTKNRKEIFNKIVNLKDCSNYILDFSNESFRESEECKSIINKIRNNYNDKLHYLIVMREYISTINSRRYKYLVSLAFSISALIISILALK